MGILLYTYVYISHIYYLLNDNYLLHSVINTCMDSIIKCLSQYEGVGFMNTTLQMRTLKRVK